MIKISIIIPVYNHAEELVKTLAALKAQTFKDFEVIVINDGSTDNTSSVLREFVGIRVMDIPHSGAARARNVGASMAQGKYLIFLDADAELTPNALEKFLTALEANAEAAFVYSSFYFGWKKFTNLEWSRERLKKNNFIHTTSLIRKEKFPGFDESLKRFQDWDLWLTISKHGGKGIWIPEILFKIAPRKSGGISKWLPSFMYKIPWLKVVKEYRQAVEIIKRKHGL